MFNAYLLVIIKEEPSGLELEPPSISLLDSFMNIIPFVITATAASKTLIIRLL